MFKKIFERISGRRGGPDVSRHAYKEVWGDLSNTEDAAKIWVQGSTDEDQLARSADYFVAQLDRLVNIHPTDDFLEIGCGVRRLGAVLAGRCRSWTGADVSVQEIDDAWVVGTGRK